MGLETLPPNVVDKDEQDRALATAQYWDEQYAKSSSDTPTHEWLRGFSDLESFFQSTLPSRRSQDNPLILHLGSGDSTIPADLASLGFHHQVCIDFSTTVVNMMTERHRSIPGITWYEQDLRDMGAVVADKSVDVAFDKSTLDAMIYGNPWNAPADVKENTGKYLAEVHRVLKDDGVLLCLSFRQPHFMKPLLTTGGLWDIEVRVLGGSGCFNYFGFVMTKKRP
ncbi:hypothetical protein BT67DRAFT_400405 [Trichocladium antarcticum]|uniref:Methyltransferase domain-containing protein n=1 Tax=Trichocladium antarcticum TaxID=1450529 RepID=A0AAN6ZFF8_9PEZI|nr:hypothetical protein BT67DRAFT_400405 [Trichocladium antarcticum]